jgi:hypothetical protein
MKTTTVRFDAETWDDIVRQSEALGIAHAEFIRGAVHRRLGGLDAGERVTELERRLDGVATRLDGMARVVAHLARRGGPVSSKARSTT